MLDGLVRRAVLTESDRVVCVNEHDSRAHQTREPDRVTRIVGKYEECTAVGYESAMQGDAIHHGRHAELAHPVVHVVAARIFGGDGAGTLEHCVVGRSQVGGAAEDLAQRGTDQVQHGLRGLPGGLRRGLFEHGIECLRGRVFPALRQLAPRTAIEFPGELRMRRPIAAEELAPRSLGRGTRPAVIPSRAQLIRHDKRLVGPVQCLARGGHFVRTERLAVSGGGSLFIRSAPTDDGFATDQRRTGRLGTGSLDRCQQRLRIMTIDVRDHVPVISLESLRRVVGKPALHFAVDGDAVVVVKNDELAQPMAAREGTRLVRDALHEAPVAGKRIGEMIDNLQPRTIELRGEHLFRKRHADRVGESLPERPGGRLDAERRLVLRMTRRTAAELPKILDLLQTERIPRQIQERVQQHRTVTVRKHEAVAVDPEGIARIVLEKVAPQNLRNVGHAHGHAWMTRIGALYGVHGKCAEGIGELAACSHAVLRDFRWRGRFRRWAPVRKSRAFSTRRWGCSMSRYARCSTRHDLIASDSRGPVHIMQLPSAYCVMPSILESHQAT